MSRPFIVMSAPNGARRGKADHPEIPLTPAEIAACAEEIADAGAAMIHLHVRDDSGAHSLDPDRYRQAIGAVRERLGERLVIQVTTEACGVYTPPQQMAAVRDLRPEAVSLALAELCPDDEHEATAGSFFAELDAAGVMIQYILYSAGDVARFAALRERGVIPDARPFLLLVLGRYSESLTGDPGQLDSYLDELPQDAVWMVCCFGPTENRAVAVAAAAGGHARVGFENNLLLPEGELAPNNASLVRLAVECGSAAGRRIATADEVRELLR